MASQIEVQVVIDGDVRFGPREGFGVIQRVVRGTLLWVDPSNMENGFFKIVEPAEFAGEVGWIRISALAPTGGQRDG